VALGLIVVACLVLANGFFVATEFAIVAVRRSKLDQLAGDGNTTAAIARDVVGRLDTYIAACQLGITMASLALGWIGEPAFSDLFEPPLERVFGPYAPTAARSVSAGLAFAIITALHIVIGELAPKGLALQNPVGTTLFVVRPMRLFYLVFWWPITLLNAVGNGVLRLFGVRPANAHDMAHSVDELRLLVQGMQAAGTVEASEARIASRAFQFGDRAAAELMAPRTEVDGVPLSSSLEDLLVRARTTTHSRLLVYEGSLDNVVGMLHVRDLFNVLDQPSDGFDLRALLRPVLVVPESKPADDLLEEMRAARRYLALVVDEFGGTAGIVTLEDLVEALVGRIEEEPALGAEEPHATPVDIAEDGSMLLDGLTRLDEFEEITGVQLDETLRDTVDTVGGLVMASLGRIPELGDEVAVAGHRLRVERLDGRRVAAVRLLHAPRVDREEDSA
jgi:putative hemolysin